MRGRKPDLEPGEDQDQHRPADQRRHDRQLPGGNQLLQHREPHGRGLERLHMDRNPAQRDGLEPGLDHVAVSVCPQFDSRAGGLPGARLAYTNIREIEKALDGGAMTVVLPTLDSAAEARDLVQMVYYPPIGKRKYSPGQWQTLYANVPGGYRADVQRQRRRLGDDRDDRGFPDAYEIAQVPEMHGVFGATGGLGNFSGFVNGQNDYDYLITHTHNAAHFAGQAGVHVVRPAQQGGPQHDLQPELIRPETQCEPSRK